MSSPVRPTAPAAASGHVLSRGRRRLVPVFVLAAALSALALVEQPTLSAHGSSARQAKASEVGLLTRKTPDAEVRSGPEREVGMRFKAKVAGTAMGVRYYKPRKSKASTPESATLWSKSGKILARTKLSPVKGTGWKKVRFDSGVKLTAGKVYVVSVHTGAKGIHPATPGGFSKAKSNAQLRAPGDSNGVTRPGSKARFPSHEARGDANYWVDVRFVPAGGGGATPTPDADADADAHHAAARRVARSRQHRRTGRHRADALHRPVHDHARPHPLRGRRDRPVRRAGHQHHGRGHREVARAARRSRSTATATAR